MNKTSRLGFLTAFIAAALFSAAAPLGKPLQKYFTDLQLAGLLYLGAALGVSLILLREKSFQLPWQMPRQDALRLSGAILFGGILGPVFLLAGLRMAAAASVSLWLNLEMVATAVLGALIFKDHLSGRGWIASLTALGAATMLAWGGGTAGFKAGGLVALACLCWGMDNHLTALIDGISPAQSTFWKGLVAGSVNLLLGMSIVPLAASPVSILAAMALGAVAYGLSILLYITASQHLGATRGQLIFSSAPFFGLLIALLLGETLSWVQGAALLLFSVAIFLLFKETHSHLHQHRSYRHMHIHNHVDAHHDHPHPEGLPENQWHSHAHDHQAIEHSHPHWPDLHHRHEHE